MANHKSAEKRARQIEKRTTINRNRVSRIRTFIKGVETAIQSGDKTKALDALKAAQPEMMRGASKGVFHINTISRKISRLVSRIKGMA
jgi:small subunit ribosomal protein S20